MSNDACYLTTDLEIRSDRPIIALIDALGDLGAIESSFYHKFIHDAGPDVSPRYHVNLNAIESDDDLTADRWHLRTPEQHITTILDGLEQLTGEALDVWSQLTTREFNMGYEVGSKTLCGRSFQLPLSTLKRIVSVNATLAWTLYPVETTKQRN